MEHCRILTQIYTEWNSGDYAECYDSELLGALNTIIMLHLLYTHPSCRVQRRVLSLSYWPNPGWLLVQGQEWMKQELEHQGWLKSPGL